MDSAVFSVVRSPKLRRSWAECDDLLVYRSAKRWHNVTADVISSPPVTAADVLVRRGVDSDDSR